MAEYENLSPAAVKELVETLNPWFQGEQQKSILKMCDALVNVQGQDVLDNIQALFDRFADLASVEGGSMVGIEDVGGYFTGTSVEDALQELGVNASKYLRYDQLGDTIQWTVNHNFGRRPQVQIYSPGGVEVWAQVTHTSENQVVIDFDQPQGGYAILE